MRLQPIVAAATLFALSTLPVRAQQTQQPKLNPATMRKLGTVDPRYVSYNIEMVEVTGGRFWKPYAATESEPAITPSNPNQQVGISPNLFQYRPPIHLDNPRLRKLATALGPAYVRVSGTWANTTYFQNDGNPPLQKPPAGFNGVLTRAEWKGVVDFAHAVDDKIVTSVAVSAGTRNAQGVWTPDQARALFNYTKSIGGSITASEFMNEPTFPGPGGAPTDYYAAAFARDAKLFGAFLRQTSPQTTYLGPGGVGEGVSLTAGAGRQMKRLATEDLLKATGPIFDAFSYHFYGAVSHRCMGKTTVDEAMTPEWLDRTDTVEAFYAELRDKYVPGKPMWLNETAEAACGGDKLAAQFVDVFRYLNQLGTLAQKGVQVVMHNTLAASDYGLLDENTFNPRPDYWAALLWKRNLGSGVLDPGVPSSDTLRIYAHCATSGKGGVALVLLNTDRERAQTLTIPVGAEDYTLTAASLTSETVLLNGTELTANADGTPPALKPRPAPPGNFQLPPASVAFLVFPAAGNRSCRGL